MTQSLPHDLEAEASVLGAVLLRNRAMADVGKLDSRDFYDPKNESVWAAMRALRAHGYPIDTVTLEHRIV